jgi:hypothetical protein
MAGRPGRGRLQQQLLQALYLTTDAVQVASILPGRSGFEKRRALRRLAEVGFVREVGPDTWIALRSQLGCKQVPSTRRKRPMKFQGS